MMGMNYSEFTRFANDGVYDDKGRRSIGAGLFALSEAIKYAADKIAEKPPAITRGFHEYPTQPYGAQGDAR